MPAAAKLDINLTIKVDGVVLSNEDLKDLIDLTVDSDYYLPTMFDFTLDDNFNGQNPGLSHTDGNRFKVGAAVVISLEAAMDVAGSKHHNTLVEGVITSLEPEFGEDGRIRLHVQGYDRAYYLMAGDKTRVFGGGTKGSIREADIFNKISQENRLSSEVSPGLSALNESYVLQYAQTDWSFLWSRAQRFGYQVYVRGTKLFCCKANEPREGGSMPIELEWGKGLTTYEPRVSIVGQVNKAVVTGWNVETKKKILETNQKSTLSMEASVNDSISADRLGQQLYPSETRVHKYIPDVDASLAAKMADAELSARESNLIQGSGFMQYGDPQILAGCKVKIKGIGTKFAGTYYVTHARHNYSQGGYTVDFDVSGTTPHSLFGLLQSGSSDQDGRSINGVVVAVVTSNNDPDKLGRVQVKFPWLPADGGDGAELSSNWARLATAGAGKARGLLFMPEVDDEVLVAFENGNLNTPYVLGGLWNKVDGLPEGSSAQLAENGVVNQRVIRSRSGHMILLNDKSGEEQIFIQDKTKENSILIDSKNNAITLKSKADFTIDAGGNFIVKAQGDVKFEATGKFEISKIKSFTATALQEAVLKVSSNQLAVKAAGAELSGLTVDIKATAKVSVSGNGMAEIKGGLVKIN